MYVLYQLGAVWTIIFPLDPADTVDPGSAFFCPVWQRIESGGFLEPAIFAFGGQTRPPPNARNPLDWALGFGLLALF